MVATASSGGTRAANGVKPRTSANSVVTVLRSPLFQNSLGSDRTKRATSGVANFPNTPLSVAKPTGRVDG